jgi:hypothetical protein
VSRFACILLCAALLGCKAFRMPAIPEHPAGEAAPSLGAARIGPVSGGASGVVSAEDRGEFVGRLREDLVATGLFTRVLLDPSVPADVIVGATYDGRNCLAHNFMMVVTLGIVPDLSCYQSGYQLTLTGAALPHGRIEVDNRSRPITMIGWVAGPVSLLPGWSSSIPRAEEGEALRAAILAAIAGGGSGGASSDETR